MGDKMAIFDGVLYHYEEDDKVTSLKQINPDKDGYKININFSKDKEENKKAKEAIGNFFMREVF